MQWQPSMCAIAITTTEGRDFQRQTALPQRSQRGVQDFLAACVQETAIVEQFFAQQPQRGIIASRNRGNNRQPVGSPSVNDAGFFPAGKHSERQKVPVEVLEDGGTFRSAQRLPSRTKRRHFLCRPDNLDLGHDQYLFLKPRLGQRMSPAALTREAKAGSPCLRLRRRLPGVFNSLTAWQGLDTILIEIEIEIHF